MKGQGWGQDLCPGQKFSHSLGAHFHNSSPPFLSLGSLSLKFCMRLSLLLLLKLFVSFYVSVSLILSPFVSLGLYLSPSIPSLILFVPFLFLSASFSL